jgi:hypothetical protein
MLHTAVSVFGASIGAGGDVAIHLIVQVSSRMGICASSGWWSLQYSCRSMIKQCVLVPFFFFFHFHAVPYILPFFEINCYR